MHPCVSVYATDNQGVVDNDYDLYLTIRRNMHHSDVDFSAVTWLHAVFTLLPSWL